MIIEYNSYLTYEIPNNWDVEENEDTFSLYKLRTGKGAITTSSYEVELNEDTTLVEHMIHMSEIFITENNLDMEAIAINTDEEPKYVLYGDGKDEDWYIKLWVVGCKNKVLIVTYNAVKKSRELKTVDKIINSFQFNL